MSNRNNLIIAIQDNVTDLNVTSMILSVSVILFFISLVLAFIMRKELKKSLSNGVFTPDSKMPGRFRLMFFCFLGVSIVTLIVSGVFFSKSQDLKHTLAEQQIMIENAVRTEELERAERQKFTPITAEELVTINQEVEDDLKVFQARLKKQAEAIAAKNPNTTVEAEYEKLLAEYEGPVVTDRPIPPERPTHEQLKKQADKDVGAVINAIIEEPIRQVEAERLENSEQSN